MQNLELDLSLTKFTPFQCFINLKKNLKTHGMQSRGIRQNSICSEIGQSYMMALFTNMFHITCIIASWSNNWIKKYKPNFTSKHWNIYCIYTPKRCYTEFLPNVILSDGFRHFFCKGPSEIFFPDKVGMLMERLP